MTWLEVFGTPTFGPVSSVSMSASLAKLTRDEPSAKRSLPRFQRRRTGLIRDTITAVLAEHPDGLRMRDIAAAVTKRLGELVPPSFIKSCLSREAWSDTGKFERVGRGRYRLRPQGS